jgi:DNA modification methylase
MVATDGIKLNPHNPRTHLAGHGRFAAARLPGLKTVPVIVIAGLSEAKKRALALADNRIAQNAGWDRERLAIELASLPEILVLENLDISITGFEPAEIDTLQADFENEAPDPADDLDPSHVAGPAVTRPHDLWQLNQHRLLCGDARHSDAMNRLMGGDRAHMAFLDPPYNMAVRNIVGRGRAKHGEFAMASGEMSRETFTTFLTDTLAIAARTSIAGAVHYVCIDWRHICELVTASREVYGGMLNLITWVKTNAGQGSFYRSQHELIGVFRVGGLPHLNTVELGRHGRSRSNVWRYAGANTSRAGRMDDLRTHPTCKPVAMVADAIKDWTRRDHIVLDTFASSGTTMLAAERVGRCARGVEIDPHYVDVAIRRWQVFTGRDALHVDTGPTFDEIAAERAQSGTSSAKRRARR